MGARHCGQTAPNLGRSLFKSCVWPLAAAFGVGGPTLRAPGVGRARVRLGAHLAARARAARQAPPGAARPNLWSKSARPPTRSADLSAARSRLLTQDARATGA